MNEPSLLQRAVMLAKTLASTVSWIVALVVELVGGRFRGKSGA